MSADSQGPRGNAFEKDMPGAEDALRASEERQAFLLKLSDALRPLADPVEIQEAATRLLGEHLRANRVCYVEMSETESVVHRDYVSGVKSIAGRWRNQDFGKAMEEALRADRTNVVADIGEMPGLSDAEWEAYRAIDVAAQIVVTLFKGGRWIANFGVHSAKPRAWTTLEIQLAEETAERTWAAVERARVEAALRESEERQVFLLRLADQLSRLANPDDMVSTVASRIGPRLDLSTCVFADVDEVRQQVVVHQGWNRDDVPSLKQTFRMADYLTEEFQRAGRAGEAMVIRDTANDSRVVAEAYARLKVGAFVIVPFHRGGRWTHFFAASSSAPRDWSAEDLTLFREISDRVFPRLERARAEAALAESDERYRLALFASGMGTFVWYVDEDRGEPDAKMRELFGLPLDGQLNLAAALGRLIVPEDRAHYAEAVGRALDPEGDGILRDVIRVIRDSDGAERWISITGRTEFEGAPRHAVRIPGMAQDITDQKRADERQRLLLAELQHRVRNILATIRSIVHRSTQNSETVEELSMHLDGRINSLARTQVILTRNPGAGVDLEEILREELLTQPGVEQQITIEGPAIQLSPKAAEVVTLALHELATNAIKYGALKDAGGRIAIAWRIGEREGERWLRLGWTESGVKVLAAAPRREGFGSELITRRVPYELAGTGTFKLRPGGVHAIIEFPLRPGGSILETAGRK